VLELLRRAHGSLVFGRRARVLAEALAEALPREGRVLDVGAGDGTVDALVMALSPGLSIEGVDVLVRRETRIPVSPYDGRRLPWGDGAFDWVLFVDTVHHADDPGALLAEGARVARRGVVIKDHLCEGGADRAVLAFMDWVGNRPHGVASPCRYLGRAAWTALFGRLGLRVERWDGAPPLYPPPASWLFGRSLHFVARLAKGDPAGG
jgi:SAM-dependent methyltransferase